MFRTIFNKKYLLPVIVVLVLAFVSLKFCLSEPNQLETALQRAGDNKQELVKVIRHYSEVDKNEQKLEAAKFLISNCYIHSSSHTEIYNTNNERVDFNPLQYPTSPVVREKKDSLFSVSRIEQNILWDVEELSSEYLINHIDFSIEVWEKSPWYNQVSFHQFCKYILPYRIVNEPLSNWIEILHSKYAHILDTLTDKTILSACKAVNRALASDMKYENRWVTAGLGTKSIPELLETGNGMCDDLVVYGTCVMRSLGIPVTVDFDIHGRFNYGHSWCVVFDENGQPWSFGPGEEQPGEHMTTINKNSYRKLAKIFRRNFFISPDELHPKTKDISSVPPFFRIENIIDVSGEYVETVNVECKVDKLREKQDYLYLCVYNNRQWMPLQWGQLKDGRVVFSGMGKEIMYMTAYYANNRINPVSKPFILHQDGSIETISGVGDKVNKEFSLDVLTGYDYIKANNYYKLYFLDQQRWKFFKQIQAQQDDLLTFTDLNENTLYRFEKTSRPFLVSDTLIYW